MTKISATIVADSINEQGDRLTSVLVTMPRIILSEMNTHRMLSKNTSSSRAIPFNKMVESVQDNPFIPIAWQEDHKGMQGVKYLETGFSMQAHQEWLIARDYAISIATQMNKSTYVTKQLCNRLLEPFMWTTMLITGPKSGWDNFFHLRCPSYELGIKDQSTYFKSKKDYQEFLKLNGFNYQISDENWKFLNQGQAEIHMMALAECVWDAYNESTPKQLKAGEWHIPFVDKIVELYHDLTLEEQVKVSVGMAANTSYTIVGDGSIITLEKANRIHDKCKELNHSSVFEHCARAMSDEEHNSYLKGVIELIDIDEPEYNGGIYEPKFSEKGWCNNFKGFISYRYFIDNKLNL